MTDGSLPDIDEKAIYVYTEEDLQRICGDAFVDLREIVDDEEAAESLDIIYERLTDEFYGHHE